MWWWIIILVLLLLWASWKLRGRTGPDVTSDRHRRTGGYGGGGA